jgi:hypothetical protein
MILRWLVPSLTGILFLEFASESSGFLHVTGLVFGFFYIYVGLSAAWIMYVRNKD